MATLSAADCARAVAESAIIATSTKSNAIRRTRSMVRVQKRMPAIIATVAIVSIKASAVDDETTARRNELPAQGYGIRGSVGKGANAVRRRDHLTSSAQRS